MSTDQAFEKKEAAADVERTSEGKLFVPQVDIVETEDAITLVADMPGVDEKSLDITLEKNVLTLRGVVPPPQIEGYTLAYAEYDVGNFERAFTISDQVDRQAISATVRNGVLRLTLPKSQHVVSQKIPVVSV